MTASRPGAPDRAGWKVWVAVAAGGFAGTEGRYLLSLLFPEPAGSFPWTTLTINVVGSFLLGLLTVRWSGGARSPRWVQAAVGPGLIASFTTFSAVTLTGVIQPDLLLPYLGVSVVLGLAAAAAGMALGQKKSA